MLDLSPQAKNNVVDLSSQTKKKGSLFGPCLYGKISVFAPIGTPLSQEGWKLYFSVAISLHWCTLGRLPCLGAKRLLPCYVKGVHVSCMLPGYVTVCFESYGGRKEVWGTHDPDKMLGILTPVWKGLLLHILKRQHLGRRSHVYYSKWARMILRTDQFASHLEI